MIYTVKEVAKIIHTNPAYVYSLIHKGLLPVIKLGSYKIRSESLDEFLKANETINPRKDVIVCHPLNT